MRSARAPFLGALGLSGVLLLVSGCGTSEEQKPIDLTDQVITKPKKPLKPPTDDDFRPSERRARKAAAEGKSAS